MKAGAATRLHRCIDCGFSACEGLDVVWSVEHAALLCGKCHGHRAPKIAFEQKSAQGNGKGTAGDDAGFLNPEFPPPPPSSSNGSGSAHVVQGRNENSTPFVAGSPQSSLLTPTFTGEVESLLSKWEAGRIDPVPVELPPLPTNATQPMREVVGFFIIVNGLRLWADDDRDVPFAGAWVAGKIGLSEPTVWRALNALVGCGVLKRTGQMPGRGKRGTFLYAPGDLPGRDTGKGGLRAIDGGKVDTCRCDPPGHNTYVDEDGDRRCLDCAKRREGEES